MLFTDAHSVAPICTPTRFGLLTGTYAWRRGIVRTADVATPLLLRPGEPTLPSFLGSLGYVTACIGKWHLGLGPGGMEITDPRLTHPQPGDRREPGPLEAGFDHYVGLFHGRSKPPFVWVVDHEVTPARRGRGPDRGWRTGPPALPNTVDRRYVAASLTEEAVRFIEDHADTTFFLYLPTYNPHFPYTPPPGFRGSSRAGLYPDCVREFDWTVGSVLRALEREGIADRTLVVVTSDNGAGRFMMAEPRFRPNGGLRGSKGQIWEAGHRIPLLVRPPGKGAARRHSDAVAGIVDLPSTIADFLGHPLPPDLGPDGRSLLPEIFGEDREREERSPLVIVSNSAQDWAIRMGRWKLIRFRDGREMLFDLADDLEETNDLLAIRSDLAGRLRLELDRLGSGISEFPRATRRSKAAHRSPGLRRPNE
jgi:arylsulfatase A-like enzyme